jgi:anti-anti-sigma factor
MTRMNAPVDASGDAQVTDLMIDRLHDLRISVVGRADSSAKLRLFGVLDLATTQQLAAAADKALAGGYTQLRLDLSRVSFCDGAGIGGIIQARRTAQGYGGSLVVTRVSPRVHKVFRLVGVDALEEGAAPGTHSPSP